MIATLLFTQAASGMLIPLKISGPQLANTYRYQITPNGQYTVFIGDAASDSRTRLTACPRGEGSG